MTEESGKSYGELTAERIQELLSLSHEWAGLAESLFDPDAYESPGHSKAPSASLMSSLLAINATLTALVVAVQENTLGTYEASGRF